MLKDHNKFDEITFQNESDSEEEEEDSVILQLQTNIIHTQYSQLCKYSQLIRDKYPFSIIKSHLPQDLQIFQQEYKISEEVLLSFFQYFHHSKLIITNDNYRDLYKLSEFFQVKTIFKLLKKYSIAHNDDIEFNIAIFFDEISIEPNQLFLNHELSYQTELKLSNRIKIIKQN